MLKDRAVIAAFFLSVLTHYLILSAAGINFRKANPEKAHEKEIMLEIEVPPLVPDIGVMEEDKMIKEREEIETPPEDEKPDTTEPREPAEEAASIPEFQSDESLEEITEEAAEDILQEDMTGEKTMERVETEQPSPEEMLRYQDMVKRRIEQARRYPPWAKKHGIEGVVHISFYIMPEGSADEVKIIQRSGSEILDREAVATVRRAAPYPPFPNGWPSSYLQMEVKIVFKHN